MYKSLSTILFLGLVAFSTQSQAAPSRTPDSTFQDSCKDMYIQVISKEPVLFATCPNRHGVYKETNTVLQGIYNEDGELRVSSSTYTYKSITPSYFQHSCKNVRLGFLQRKPTVYADCKAYDNKYYSTSVTLKALDNIDGMLLYNR